ncbi:Parkin coregulated protein [Fasciola hepatica]|uniref:Parkin coregulated protein n=1 Tax=Fasciola hepatica TaxID=6192 RepID=A0A2H1CNI7_FASHE|nr:Parkin coregulated protein [Fasciola hepatica]
MPRRYPLLGTEDEQPIKAQRAFTTKAEQEIWDIGCPAKGRVTIPMGISAFRRNLHNGKYPFVPDHSSTISVPRLAWATEIQNLDYALLIPELVEGLTDKEASVNTVAMTAITDLLKHGPVEKVIDSLPTFTIAAKKAMALNNVEISRRVVEVMKRFCKIQPGIGPDLAFYMRELLDPLNYYFEETRDQNDQIIYQEKLYGDIYDPMDEVIKLFLRVAGPEIDTAERNIKRAIPTYQINRET